MSRTHPYTQSRDFRWKACGKQTSKGACFALSAWWIIQTSHNASAGFWDWLGPSDFATGRYQPPKSVNPVQEASNWKNYASRAGDVVTRIHTGMADQSFALDEGDSNVALNTKLNCVAKIIEANSALRPKRDDTKVLTYYLQPFKKDRDRPGALEVWGTELSKHRGYKFISITGLTELTSDKSYQHAIAVFTGSSTYSIFDPNFGEFNSDTLIDFQQDLKDIFRCSQVTCYSAHYARFKH